MKFSQLVSGLTALAISQIGCQTTAARAYASTLTIQSHTASDSGFDVNSHLIMGAKEAILVDAQFTRSEAKKVAEMVKQSGRSLKTIFITHGHPDHYLGLEILTKEFPSAQVLATPEVIKDIQQTAQGKLSYWKPIYKDDLADGFILPTALKSNFLDLEGEKIQVIKLGPGESENATVLYIPSLQTLVSGDVVYSSVHLWLAEDRPEGWLKNLEKLSSLGPIQMILPGHGPTGDKALISANASYIQNFMGLTKGDLKKDVAISKLEALYPDFKLPVIAELSVGARLK